MSKINWNLYKGRDTRKSKEVYEVFCELLENANYKLISEYVNNSSKVELECDKAHKYFVAPRNFKSGSRCPICYSNHTELAKLDFIKQVEKEGYKVIGEYKNATTKVEIECNKQHRYKVTPNNFKRGYRCPICSGKSKEYAKLDFIKQVEKNGYKLIGNYVNNSTKIELECNKGHRYFVIPNSFKKGFRCPICSGFHSETSKLDFIKQVESENYKVIGKYVNSYTKIELECDKHHRYFVIPSSFKSGNRCPYCNTVSHGEILAKKILDEYSCKYETQKKFDGLVGLNGGQLSYDFFVDNYLLIEIQGEQHYKSFKYYGGEEKFKRQLEHDRLKREFAKEHGYELLEIPYFGSNKLEILERMLRDRLESIIRLKAS
ncbi:hypothetical protein P7A62_00485 [Clostridium perfringens]|nr:hypothetical protein [Clostridium perfringens]